MNSKFVKAQGVNPRSPAKRHRSVEKGRRDSPVIKSRVETEDVDSIPGSLVKTMTSTPTSSDLVTPVENGTKTVPTDRKRPYQTLSASSSISEGGTDNMSEEEDLSSKSAAGLGDGCVTPEVGPTVVASSPKIADPIEGQGGNWTAVTGKRKNKTKGLPRPPVAPNYGIMAYPVIIKQTGDKTSVTLKRKGSIGEAIYS